MSSTIPFATWLVAQAGRGDALGDLVDRAFVGTHDASNAKKIQLLRFYVGALSDGPERDVFNGALIEWSTRGEGS